MTYWHAPDGNKYPLVDADGSLYATVLARDVICGVKGDPCRCAIAQCFMRAAGSPCVMIGVDKAYVVVKKKGEWVALRFSVPIATRRLLESWVLERDGFPEDTVELAPPRPSDTLESSRAADKRRRHRWSEKDRGRVVRSHGSRDAQSLARTAKAAKAKARKAAE